MSLVACSVLLLFLVSANTALAQPPLAVEVRELWATTGDPGFSNIRGMAQWPDGSVWIGDGCLAEVCEVSPDGEIVRVVLKEGEGPGEVGRVHRIDELLDGGMVVLTNSHYEVFGPDKRFRHRRPDRSRVWNWGFAAYFQGFIHADLCGNGARVIVEDEDIVSSSELERAVTHGPNNETAYTNAWTKSTYVREMEDGNILNVVLVYPENPEDAPTTSLWVVVSPEGEVLAQTPLDRGYTVWNDTPYGHLLASYWDNERLEPIAVKLEVTVTAR